MHYKTRYYCYCQKKKKTHGFDNINRRISSLCQNNAFSYKTIAIRFCGTIPCFFYLYNFV